ncbi:FAD-dependent monooxygenase [Streptomyces sp. RB6PN25]|uniref:FAD-dependent monooxygenase n=1 Tax=Streptomyces humicola TaxID=2953240 RepID=A0ABT1PZ53_9ACTN|nr:FAD-dependent monooxygenase [Streptomyces humicola]MCQ4082937.1 FAD-dependent monooxygenase [Streptomyces humicola]
MDPVIVAGAGPTGLALSLCLARHSVPVVLLDGGGVPSEQRPERTAVLRPQTADLLSRLGYTAVHRDAARWTAWRTMRRRQELLRVEFADGDGDGNNGESDPAPRSESSPLHLTQDRLCHGLRNALVGQSLVTIAHGARLTAIEQDEDGVSVHTSGGAGAPEAETWWRGSFVVGCDGPRSTLRKLLGVRFPGRSSVQRYAVAALRTELPFAGEALQHRDPPGARRGTEAMARPLPDGAWRLDWSLPPGGASAGAAATAAGPLTSDALVTLIRETLAGWCGGSVPAYELLGWAEHPVHQRLARHWRSGRAFLAGDAAHLLGALGTQALEEGLRDADNLAWKLALACHHGASDTLLDSYQSERRGAVGVRLRSADQAMPLLRTGGPWRTVRHSLFSGPPARHVALMTDGHLGRGALGSPPVYERSPLAPPAPGGRGRAAVPSLVGVAGTAPGGTVTDVAVIGLDGRRGRLSERFGRHLLVVLVAPGTGVWESRHWLTAGLMPQLSTAVAELPTRAELLVTEGYPGATAHTVLVVRPDGHLVGAMTGCRPAELYAHADAARGGLPTRHPRRDTSEHVGEDAGAGPGSSADEVHEALGDEDEGAGSRLRSR